MSLDFAGYVDTISPISARARTLEQRKPESGYTQLKARTGHAVTRIIEAGSGTAGAATRARARGIDKAAGRYRKVGWAQAYETRGERFQRQDGFPRDYADPEQAVVFVPSMLLEERFRDDLSYLERAHDLREPPMLDCVREEGNLPGCGIMEKALRRLCSARRNQSWRWGNHSAFQTRNAPHCSGGLALR